MTNTADIRGIRYANRAACRACVLRSRCTGTTYLYIPRYANEAILERMAERIAARPGLQACRRELVEHPSRTSDCSIMNRAFFPLSSRVLFPVDRAQSGTGFLSQADTMTFK